MSGAHRSPEVQHSLPLVQPPAFNSTEFGRNFHLPKWWKTSVLTSNGTTPVLNSVKGKGTSPTGVGGFSSSSQPVGFSPCLCAAPGPGT